MSSYPKQGRVLVTGASSGIGAAYATKLAQLGYSLSLVARRRDRLEALAKALQSKFGVNVDVQVADLENPDHLTHLESRLVGGAFVGLVNNAGSGGLGSINASGAQDLERNLRLNIVALARLSEPPWPASRHRARAFWSISAQSWRSHRLRPRLPTAARRRSS